MGKKRKITLLFGLVIFFIAISSFSSCGNKSNGEAIWFRDPYGSIHTNDIKRIQPEIPFAIITPTYLPKNVGNDKPDGYVGPIHSIDDSSIEVDISYDNGEGIIYITEKNNLKVMGPNSELDPEYLMIEGINILMQKSHLYLQSGTVEGLVFDWTQDGVTFSVELFYITQNEAIKVVESMVKQMK